MISSLHAFLYSWAWFRVRVWDQKARFRQRRKAPLKLAGKWLRGRAAAKQDAAPVPEASCEGLRSWCAMRKLDLDSDASQDTVDPTALSVVHSSPSQHHVIPASPIPAHPIPSPFHPIPAHPSRSHPIPSHPISSHLSPAHPSLSKPIPAYPITSNPIPSHPSPSQW